MAIIAHCNQYWDIHRAAEETCADAVYHYAIDEWIRAMTISRNISELFLLSPTNLWRALRILAFTSVSQYDSYASSSRESIRRMRLQGRQSRKLCTSSTDRVVLISHVSSIGRIISPHENSYSWRIDFLNYKFRVSLVVSWRVRHRTCILRWLHGEKWWVGSLIEITDSAIVTNLWQVLNNRNHHWSNRSWMRRFITYRSWSLRRQP